eukprot:365338-Chlamydomonas_euryale.AAC.43
MVQDLSSGDRTFHEQTWREAVRNLAPVEFKKPQQVGCMTRPTFAMTGVENVVQFFPVCDRRYGSECVRRKASVTVTV